MKTFRTILLIAGVLVAGLAFSSVTKAQKSERAGGGMYVLKYSK